MIVSRIDPRTIKVVAQRSDYDLNAYYDNLAHLESRQILTFGDSNFRTFETYFRTHGFRHEALDLCFFDDQSIGLEMPKTWYLNKGKHALSIAMYYNYLTYHAIVENKNLDTFNQDIARDYGRCACIEVYFENDLKRSLDAQQIEYFGTPRTLTECVRYLEGWNLAKYPRLKGYATFSKFIELWSRIHFPQFNADEWHLGKKRSQELNAGGRTTNVRKAIQYFWQNYLLTQHRHVSEEDIEIDVLGGRFHQIRRPDVVLVSEDLFSSDNSSCEIFTNLTRRLARDRIYLSKRKNGFPEKNAAIARELYGDALVVLLEYDSGWGRNFSLINPVKHALNEDVVVATGILRRIVSDYFPLSCPTAQPKNMN